MCLLVCAWRVVPGVPLLVLANRDEFYARPTAPLERWEDGLLAGRDLKGGGTWLAVHGRRFAALTNIREPGVTTPPQAPSRGELIPAFLRSGKAGLAWLESLSANRYAGYNLLLFDGEHLAWGSNRQPSPQVLQPGIYGLSNAALNTPWPKLLHLRDLFSSTIDLVGPALARTPLRPERLLSHLQDELRPPDAQLPETGVGLEVERLLSSIRIRGEGYGTRSSSVVRIGSDRSEVWEQTYDPAGELGPTIYAATPPFTEDQFP